MTTDESGRVAPGLRVVRVVLPVLIVAAAIGAAIVVYETRPRPQRRPPMRMAPLVRVLAAERADHTPELTVYGNVVASRAIDLVARVTGDVAKVHPMFREGGIIPAGETVIEVDDKDYRLAIARAESTVARAELEFAVEQGAAEVAQRERALLGDGDALSPLEEKLVRREPQRDAAAAALAAAKSDLALARLNLERTRVTAPFTAIVLRRDIELGGNVSPQKTVARLADAESYWVRAAVPLDRLSSIQMPDGAGAGGAAIVRSSVGRDLDGRIIGVEGAVDAQGRMARVLVAVSNPHANGTPGVSPSLLLGDYVSVRLACHSISNAVRMPREALRDGDRVWLADAANRLVVRAVTVAWQDQLQVYLATGVEPGERIVVTAVATPVPGIELRVADVAGRVADPAEPGPEPEPEPEPSAGKGD